MADEDYKRIFSKNLRYYMNLRNKNQMDLMNDLKLSSSTVSNWCTGLKLPRMDKVQLLADYLGVLKSDLIEDKSIGSSNSTNGIEIPVLGRVAAGIPITATEYIIDTEEISQAMAADGDYFALQIKGDSMEPKISNGDVVIVRKQSDADDGDLVIALVNGDDAVCKRLKKYEEGIALLSNNPAYNPMYFSNKDIVDKPVSIIGKVKELRAKF